MVNKAANDLSAIKLHRHQPLQLMYGVVARPNYPMLRRDESGSEYEVFFDKEGILDMYNQFKDVETFDIEHDEKPIKVQIVKQFITDVLTSKKFNCEIGSWVLAVYIPNKNLWNMISEGIINGFSPDIDTMLLKDDIKLNKNDLKMKNKLKIIALKKVADQKKIKLGQLVKDGITYEYEELKEGADIWTINEDGVVSVPPNSTYEIEGKAVTVADGIITKIEDKVEDKVETETELSKVDEILTKIKELEDTVTELIVSNEELKTFKEKMSKAAVDVPKKRESQLSLFGIKPY